MDRLIRSFCANASFLGGSIPSVDVDAFLENHSDIYFCHGKLFRLVFEKITESTYSVKREWL